MREGLTCRVSESDGVRTMGDLALGNIQHCTSATVQTWLAECIRTPHENAPSVRGPAGTGTVGQTAPNHVATQIACSDPTSDRTFTWKCFRNTLVEPGMYIYIYVDPIII